MQEMPTEQAKTTKRTKSKYYNIPSKPFEYVTIDFIVKLPMNFLGTSVLHTIYPVP